MVSLGGTGSLEFLAGMVSLGLLVWTVLQVPLDHEGCLDGRDQPAEELCTSGGGRAPALKLKAPR